MEATHKNEKTECLVHGQWIEYHLSSHLMNDGSTQLEKDRYILLGYGNQIKVDGVIFRPRHKMKFFKGSM